MIISRHTQNNCETILWAHEYLQHSWYSKELKQLTLKYSRFASYIYFMVDEELYHKFIDQPSGYYDNYETRRCAILDDDKFAIKMRLR